jgi:hypothetical protein
MDENSPQGKALVFNDPYIAELRDDDLVSVRWLYDINCEFIPHTSALIRYFSMGILCDVNKLIYRHWKLFFFENLGHSFGNDYQ